MIRPRLRALMSVPPFVLLAACAGLFGGGKPAQLYRFGSIPAATTGTRTVPAPRIAIALEPIRFATEIDNDRLLASQGTQTSYIKGIRWVSPGPALLEQALREGLRRDGASVLVSTPGDGMRADARLRVDVRRFEAGYASPGAIPTIILHATATFEDPERGRPTTILRIEESSRASANDATSIVAAFDDVASAAVRKIVGQVSEGAAEIAPQTNRR